MGEVVGPIHCLPKQVFLARRRYAMLERVPDVSVDLVGKQDDARIRASKLAYDRIGAVGGTIVHEDNLTGGVGAEVAAIIAKNAFEYLDAPVHRVAAPDVPSFPYSPTLEDALLPGPADIVNAARELAAGFRRHPPRFVEECDRKLLSGFHMDLQFVA